MTTTREKHPVYQLYVLLADRGGLLTEPAGRQLIKTVLPQFAATVDEIIDAGGDPDKLKEHMERIETIYAEEDGGNADLNNQLRSDAKRSRDESGRFASQNQGGEDDESEEADDSGGVTSGQNGGEGKATPGTAEGQGNESMNAALRRKASRGVSPAEGEDWNQSLRRAAGRNSG